MKLDHVPSDIFSGNVITPQRLAIYQSVIEHPDVPTLAPATNETTTAYVKRLFAQLETTIGDNPFTIEITPLDRPEERYEYDDPGLVDENSIGISVSVGNPDILDISLFDRQMRACDPLVVANLVHNFGRATQFTFDAFTPVTAIEACEWHLFHGYIPDWYDDIRAEIAGNGRDYDTISRKAVQQYIKANGLRTPGSIRRQAGAHYARLVKSPERLTANEIAERITKLPLRDQRLANAFAHATLGLERISHDLREALTPYDRALFTGNSAPFAQPGLILESTGAAEVICEIIDEIYQEAAQGDGFGVNYVLTLDSSRASVDRFLATLRRFQNAAAIIESLTIDIAAYNEADA